MTNVDEEIKAAAHSIAKAKIAAALLGEDLLQSLVDGVMNHKSVYSPKQTFLERAIEEHIQGAIRDAIREHFAERADEVKRTIKAAMAEDAEKFAASVVDAFAQNDWRSELTIKIDR